MQQRRHLSGSQLESTKAGLSSAALQNNMSGADKFVIIKGKLVKTVPLNVEIVRQRMLKTKPLEKHSKYVDPIGRMLRMLSLQDPPRYRSKKLFPYSKKTIGETINRMHLSGSYRNRSEPKISIQ